MNTKKNAPNRVSQAMLAYVVHFIFDFMQQGPDPVCIIIRTKRTVELSQALLPRALAALPQLSSPYLNMVAVASIHPWYKSRLLSPSEY